MVCTFNPPGVSSARANSRRASARRLAGGPGRMPMAASSAASSSVVQRPSLSNTRLAMLAAAALVNVRQRIFSGATPASSRLITRSASTCVLPEPAFAATQAETPGSDTSPCTRSTSTGMTLGDLLMADYSWRTRNVVFRPAGARPFLHAREMVVVAVARFPHRMHQRAIGLVIVVETPHQLGEFLQRAVGLRIGRAFLEVDRHELAGARAAFERHIRQLRHRAAARYRRDAAVESALAQHRGFERELRRKPGAHLFFGSHRAGLVIENHIAA